MQRYFAASCNELFVLTTEQGKISIRQDCGAHIVITPEQAELAASWILKAKDHLCQSRGVIVETPIETGK